MDESKVLAALIAGIFGVIVSLVTFVLFLLQKRVTQRLEKAIKKYEADLHILSEVHLRLYERAMEDIAKYRIGLNNITLMLGDYNNGVKIYGSNSEEEKKNNYRFYEALKEIRFPGVYVPPAIETELENIKKQYEKIKTDIYDAGNESDETARNEKYLEIDSEFVELEKKGSTLIRTWKKELLSPRGILETILGE